MFKKSILIAALAICIPATYSAKKERTGKTDKENTVTYPDSSYIKSAAMKFGDRTVTVLSKTENGKPVTVVVTEYDDSVTIRQH